MSSNRLKATVCGTPNYMAPEMIAKKGYDYKVDVWSTGVLVYKMLVGGCPFDAEKTVDIYEKIVDKPYDYNCKDEVVSVSFFAQRFIEALLQKDQKKRIALENIMEHPFMFEF